MADDPSLADAMAEIYRELNEKKVAEQREDEHVAQIGDAYQNNKPLPTAKVVPLRAGDGQKTNGKLVLRPARLPDPCSLNPRPWLYGTQLNRGYVTVLVAPGGTGKWRTRMAVALSLASHRSFLFDHIFASINVAYINLDDPMDELERRVAAVMIAHKITGKTLKAGYSSRTATDAA